MVARLPSCSMASIVSMRWRAPGCSMKLPTITSVSKWDGEKWSSVLDGRIEYHCSQHIVGGDPYAIALSFNVHRRQLTVEEWRARIDKLIIANPELSDRQLGKMAEASKNTIASARNKLEASGQIDQIEKRIDAKGHERPAKGKGCKQPKPQGRDKGKKGAPPAPAPAPAQSVEPTAQAMVQD
jgi:hypothetical protein